MTSSVFPKTKVFITHHVDAAFSGRSHTTKTLTKLQWIPTFFPHFQKPEQAGLIQIQQSWKGHSQLSTCPMWMFPKIAGTPQIIHLNGTFHYKPSILGYAPIFGSTPVSFFQNLHPFPLSTCGMRSCGKCTLRHCFSVWALITWEKKTPGNFFEMFRRFLPTATPQKKTKQTKM